MKTIVLSNFLIAFLSIGITFGQQNNLVLVESLQKHHKDSLFQVCEREFFEYDEHDNEIVHTKDYLDILELEFKNAWKITKQYSDNGKRLLKEDRIVRSRSNYDDYFTRITYEYHKDDCLKKLERIWTQGELKLSRFIHYYSLINCKIDSIILYDYWDDEWKKSERWDYEYQEKQIVRYHSLLKEGIWKEFGQSRKSFDENGNLIKSWTNISDYASEEQRVYEYDQYNNQTKASYWLKQGQSETLKLADQQISENFYDEREQLVRIEKESTTYDTQTGEILFEPSSHLQSFSYFCDGLMKDRQSGYDDNTIKWKTRYFYQMGEECSDDLDSPTITIFPNPTNLQLHVQSEALLNADCTVSLLSANGQLIYKQAVNQRINQHQIFIENLDAGIYFLSLQYEDKVITKKVVKY